MGNGNGVQKIVRRYNQGWIYYPRDL